MNVKAAAVAAGVIGLGAAAYGAFGTAVVFGDWLTCQSQGMASLASLPDCRMIPWPSQFGIGIVLILGGASGMATAWWLVRRSRASRVIPRR